MKYQIKDWNIHFENNRSRQIDQCNFVCVPNKQHGMGLAKILREPDGAAIYGIWHLIVGFCSQQRLPRDGWVTLNGHHDGTSASPDDLALKFRRPVVEIEMALSVLSSSDVGWLVYSENVIDSQVTPDRRQSDAQVRLRDEEGRKEGMKEGTGAPVDSPLNGKPDAAWVKAWAKQARQNGADYTDAEAHSAYLALAANGFKWGKNPITDYRAAIERQIQNDRDHKPAKRSKVPNL